MTGDVGMSTVTYGELIWGAQVSSKPRENLQRLRAFARLVPALELPADLGLAEPLRMQRTQRISLTGGDLAVHQ